MANSAFDLNQPNPWKNRGELHKVSPVYSVASMLVFFLCSLGLPLCTREWVPVGLIAISFLYVTWIARKPSVTVGLLLTAALLSAFGSDMIVGAVFLTLVVGCMSGAFLLTTRRIPIIVTLLLPIAAAGAAYAVTRTIEFSLLALSLAPASAALALATCKDCLRTKTLLACMGGFLMVVVIGVTVAIWKTTGGLGRGCIVQFVDTVREAIINYLLGQRETLMQLIANEATEAQSAELYAQIEAVLSPEAIRLTVEELFNTLPALITVATALLAFFAQMLLTAAYGRVGLEKVVTPKARFLTVSLTAAILFIVSFVLVLLLSDSLASATALNLSIMLMPIFFLCGVQSGMAIARSSPGARVFIFFIVGALFCCYSGGMIYMIALYGAYSRISAAITHKLMSRVGSDKGDS